MYSTLDTIVRVSDRHAKKSNETRFSVDVGDCELIERCKAGDEAAWNLLVRRYQLTIYRFAYRLCRNRDDSSDLTGHVLLQIYEKLHTFRSESSFSSWLYRIVRNSFLDMRVRPAYRKLEGRTTFMTTSIGEGAELDIVDPHPSPEQICMGEDVIRVVSKAVNELPAYVRRPMKMRAKGASYEQIANAIGINMGTVKSRLNRGRHMLKERLPRLEELLTAN